MKVGRLRKGLRWHATFVSYGSTKRLACCGIGYPNLPGKAWRGLTDVRQLEEVPTDERCKHWGCQREFDKEVT